MAQCRLRGPRVLDLGCHDGRWSFAAIEAGACHVIGSEARAQLAKKRRRIQPAVAYDIVTGDAIEALRVMQLELKLPRSQLLELWHLLPRRGRR